MSEVLPALFMIVMVVTFLLLIYFFIDWVLPVLEVLYAIAAVFIVVLLRPFIELIPFGRSILLKCSSPPYLRGEMGCCRGCCCVCDCGFQAELRKVIAAILCLGLGVIWYIGRSFIKSCLTII